MKVRSILKQSGMSFLVSNVVFVATFLGNVALVRMLLPEDFGFVALASSLVGLIEIVTTFAFNTVLIQQRDQSSLARTVFQLALVVLGLKLVLGAVFYLTGQSVYDQQIWTLFAVILASKMFSGLGPLLVARLEKRGDFLPATLVTSGATLLSVGLAVAAVYAGAGLYGLLLREALPPVIVFVAMVLVYPSVVPRGLLQANRRQLRVVAGASTRLYFQRGAELSFMRFPLLMIEAQFGAATLGLYAQTTYLVTLVNRVTSIVNQQVALVFFSRNRRDAQETRSGFLLLLAANSLVALPATVVLWVFPKDIILFLWGENWLETVPYLQVMAVMTFLLPIFTVLKSRLLGLRRNHAITFVYLAGILLLAGGLWLVRDLSDPNDWLAGLTVAAYSMMVVLCAALLWALGNKTRRQVPTSTQ